MLKLLHNSHLYGEFASLIYLNRNARMCSYAQFRVQGKRSHFDRKVVLVIEIADKRNTYSHVYRNQVCSPFLMCTTLYRESIAMKWYDNWKDHEMLLCVSHSRY